MAAIDCPRCGAPQNGEQYDPLARCEWCGALLAASELPRAPMKAEPRVSQMDVRRLVARKLERRWREWSPARPRLVFYPFALQPSARKPYRPLAAMPPALIEGWRPSGADLVREKAPRPPAVEPPAPPSPPPGAAMQIAPPPEPEEESRVPITLPLPEDASTVHLPFWRVPISRGRLESAAWCDAVSGQVILPLELAGSESREERLALGQWAMLPLIVGAAAGLLFPFPFSLVPIGIAGATAWYGSTRW